MFVYFTVSYTHVISISLVKSRVTEGKEGEGPCENGSGSGVRYWISAFKGWGVGWLDVHCSMLCPFNLFLVLRDPFHYSYRMKEKIAL